VFVALRPTLAEYIMKMPRGAQVIYPKDLATILLWADIYPGPRWSRRIGSARS
jgi:tRNA (adenine57-N1/adenine58-N1)-methyltransferase